MENVRPLADQVLLRKATPEEMVGSIVIPEAIREKPQKAKVLAVGPGRVLDTGSRLEPALKAGDAVLIGKWSGTEVQIDGEMLLIVHETDILAILEG